MTIRHIMSKDELLFIYSMGKKLRVTAIFTDDVSANEHMQRHRDDAVIACHGPFIFLANKYDKGVQP